LSSSISKEAHLLIRGNKFIQWVKLGKKPGKRTTISPNTTKRGNAECVIHFEPEARTSASLRGERRKLK